MRFTTIRWKLFALISGTVALPVLCLTAYFPASRVAGLQEALATKAHSFSNLMADNMRSAIAFNDSETARETLAAVTTDADVAYVALLRGDGSILAAAGMQKNAGTVSPRQDSVTSIDHDRVRVISPIVSREGPRGTLVLELSTSAARAEGAANVGIAIVVGLACLFIGCCGAWAVGRSFGRRIARIKKESQRVAAGDLSDTPPVDGAADEIGQMAAAFRTMVHNLRVAHANIEKQVVDRTEDLRASHDQNRALLETTDAVPWEMETPALRFTYMGPQAETLFGIPMSAWASFEIWSAYLQRSDRDRVVECLNEVAAAHKEQPIEFAIQHPAGRRLWVRMLISRGPKPDGRTLRGFMFDITERAEMEIELRQAQKLESVGRLAAGVAHEINTPVQFVSDSVHFVRDCFGDVLKHLDRYRALRSETGDPEALSSMLTELEQAGQDLDLEYLAENGPKALERALEGLGRVTAIVRSMKEFAHPDQQEKTEANVNNALTTTLTVARNEYKDVADIQTAFSDDLPRVSCHIGELNQAFLNIIVNAAHAIGDNKKGESRGTIRVATRRDGDEAVVEISDDGGGIPESIHGRIFDPFFTTKEVGRGTGQGLAIAHRSVVERHAGSLTFQSQAGQGTTFVIRLPLAGSTVGSAAGLVS